MAKEPRVESNIYDLTGNLANAPADDGYPIAAAVFTPAGPIEKRKVLSQRDFIDNYLLGSTVLPTDNESIKFIFKLLELNPVYLMRACPVSLLEGISSTGAKLLFDKSYALLPSYKKMRLANLLDELSYYWISLPSGDKKFYSQAEFPAWKEGTYYKQNDFVMVTKVVSETVTEVRYYCCRYDHTSGPSFDADPWFEVVKSGSGADVVANAKSIDLLTDLMADSANRDGFNPDIMASGPGYISSRRPLPGTDTNGKPLSHSNNIGKFTELVDATRFCQASTDSLLTEDEDTACVSELNYLNIDGSSYYFSGTGRYGVPKVDSPVAISSPNALGLMTQEYFMLKVMAESECVREGGFGRMAVALGTPMPEEESGLDDSDDINTYCAEILGCNVPGFILDNEPFTFNGNTYDMDCIAMTSNRYFVPSELGVPDYGTQSFKEHFAYLSLRIRDTELDPKSESESSSESESASEDDVTTPGYRYRIYIWGPGEKLTIGKTSELSGNYKYNRMLVENLLGFKPMENPEDSDFTGYPENLDWDAMLNGQLSIVYVSSADNSISNSRFLSKVLDKIIGTEKRKTSEGLYTQIYDSSNSLDNKSPVLFKGTLVMTTSEDNPMSSDFYKITTDSGEGRHFYQYYTSSDSDNDEYRTADFMSVQIDNVFYYTGDPNKGNGLPVGITLQNMAEGDIAPKTIDEFNALLQYYAYLHQNLSIYDGSFVLTDTEAEVTVSSNLNLQLSDDIVQTTQDQFAVVQKFPAGGSIFQFSYNKSSENPDILELTLNYKQGVMRENWTLSFVPGVVNGYGIDQFYTRVNNDYFQVVNLAGDGNLGNLLDSYISPSFGKKVAVPEFKVEYMSDAMQTLPNYEDGQYYYMLTDSGVVNPGYASVIQTLCSELHSWYPISLPNTSSTADLVSFVGAAGINSYFVRMLAASDRMDIAGFSSVMPGSYKLIQSILSLYRSQSNEFAPNYDLRNGSISMSNPTQSFKKSARELLLDYKIETLKGGIGTDYYINDNVTAQKSTSYLSENQNVLMTIAAVHECEAVARSYKAELNTASTRKRLEDALNAALQNRLFKGKAYSPYAYWAVCDASNNTLQVINNNQLVADIYAQFTPSAKVIILNHYIIPLDQA